MQWLLAIVIFCVGSFVACDDFGITDSFGLMNDGVGWLDKEYISRSGDDYRGYRTERSRTNKNGPFYTEEEQNRLDKIYGYTGPTANDEPENLIRPCALDDWQCIRKYFAANSQCVPAHGPTPDPLTLGLLNLFIPIVNMTMELPNQKVTGLSSGKVSDFYFNKRSGNLVIAIDVEDFNQTTPRAYFRYRRTAKESIILADFTTINFRSVTFTAVIPKDPYLRLDLADVHADVRDGTPQFFIGPGAYNSTDPDVVTAFTQFGTLISYVVREGFLFQSQLFTAIYIQSNICDFGLKLISI